MNKEDGGPAFPTESEGQTGATTWRHEGMTMRDYFAAKAMQALALQVHCWRYSSKDADTAARCYEMADAMIRARSKE